MRAIAASHFGDPDQLAACDLAAPSPRANQVLVTVRAAALNAADLKVLGRRDGAMFLHAKELPAIPGYDVSGIVAESGASVFAKGDEVFGFLPYARTTRGGTCAEQVVIAASCLAKKPAGVTHEQAAAVATTGAWALQLLRDKAKVKPGSRVLLHGASGGVGSYAIQIAKLLGATVTATASAEKLDHIRALGADRAIDYKATPLPGLDGEFDVIADLATKSSFGECRRLLAPGGVYAPTLPSGSLVTGMLRALLSSKRVAFVIAQSRPADLALLASWIADGKLTSAIDRTYPLAELPAALTQLQRGTVRGKLVVAVRD